MKKILIHNNSTLTSLDVKKKLIRMLSKHGKQIVKHHPDVIVVLGGDGTMLSAIRKYRLLHVPFVGIDTGTLGFLTTIMPDALEKIFEVLDHKHYRVVEYPLLHVRVKTLAGDIYSEYAFNEVLIRHMDPRLMQAKVYFDQKPFNYFTGDGFIVSTPMGATGYAIWAGGAVVHSELPVYQITPLYPNDNSINRPMKSTMVIPNHSVIDLKMEKPYKKKVLVACDGVRVSGDYIDQITISVDPDHNVRVIRSDDYDYYALYKRKIIDKKILRTLDE